MRSTNSAPQTLSYTQGVSKRNEALVSGTERYLTFSGEEGQFTLGFLVPKGDARGQKLEVRDGWAVTQSGAFQIDSGQLTFRRSELKDGVTDYDWELFVELVEGDFKVEGRALGSPSAVHKTREEREKLALNSTVEFEGSFTIIARKVLKKTAVPEPQAGEWLLCRSPQ